jgi:hypothetical protein
VSFSLCSAIANLASLHRSLVPSRYVSSAKTWNSWFFYPNHNHYTCRKKNRAQTFQIRLTPPKQSLPLMPPVHHL